MPAVCPICSNQCRNDMKLQKHMWAVHREHLSDNGSLKPAVASALAKGDPIPETPEVKKEVPVSPDAPAPIPSAAELDAKLPFPCPTCDRRFGSKKGLGHHVAYCGKPPAEGDVGEANPKDGIKKEAAFLRDKASLYRSRAATFLSMAKRFESAAIELEKE